MTTVPVRKESEEWRQTYRCDLLVKRRQAGHARKLKRLGFLDLPRDVRILDACCGEGEMLDILESHGFRFLSGVDLASDKSFAEQLKTKNWRYAAASAAELPFQPGVFDWILCAHSLHHLAGLENIRRFLEQARGCLKPGGKLVLVDHYDSFQFRLALGALLSPIGCLTPMTRVFREQHIEEKAILYDYLDHWKDLKELMQNAGFENFSLEKGLFFFYAVLTKSGSAR